MHSVAGDSYNTAVTYTILLLLLGLVAPTPLNFEMEIDYAGNLHFV